MTKRSLGAVFGFGCLAILCLAQDTLVAAQRGGNSGGGSRGGSAPASAGRSSGGGGGGGSRASAPSSSGSGFSAPRSAPSAPAPSAPRSAPSAPRYQPQPGPRSQPSEAPRYQPAPRYEQPSTPRSQPSDNPRYLPPDNSGRVYDGGRSTYQPAPYAARGPASARSEAPPSSDGRQYDGSANDGATSRDQGGSDGSWNNLTFERRAPRTPIPVLSGSDRGPGAQRFGLSERRASAAAGRSAADGEGMVQIPHAPVTREAILARYSTAPRESNAALRADSGRGELGRVDSGSAGELSRARTSLTPVRAAPTASTASAAAAPKRGSVEAARREREAVDNLDRFRSSDPKAARRIDDAGAIATRATSAAAKVSVGVGVTFGTGIDCGGFWDPSCSNNSCGSGSWFWFGCNGWPVWCSPGCGGCWPYGWGFSWWGCGWGLSYSSCCYSPWSYGYCYPYWGYSYPSYWCPTPTYYSSVIYQGYDDGAAAVYQEPVVAGEAAVDAHNQIAAPQGANGKAMGRGVSQYLSLGDEAFSQGRYSEAVNAYARAVEASPDEGVLYLILSDALFATGDYHYAAYALRRSLELDPTLLSSVVDKHNFYGEPTEFDRQIALAESYLDEHFLDDDARLVLAANYLFANRPAQASDMLQSAFSKTVRESTAGALILKRADELRAAHPLSK